MNAVPLRANKDALKVNRFEIEIRDPASDVPYRNSFIADLVVDRRDVATLAASGRSQWNIENEAVILPQTGGGHLERNHGHVKRNPEATLVMFNLLAFAFHTVGDQIEKTWPAARTKADPRTRFFTRLITATDFLVFPDWRDLALTLVFAKPPPGPP